MSNSPVLWDSLIQIIQLEKELINVQDSIIGEENKLVGYYENLSKEYLSFINDHHEKEEDYSAFLERYHNIKQGQNSKDEKFKQWHELFMSVKRKATEEFMKHVLVDDSSSTQQLNDELQNIGWDKKCLAFESKMKNRILTLASQQYSMVYGISSHECSLNSNQEQSRKSLDESSSLMACIYACMILHDENLEIQSDSILKIVRASNIEVPSVYASLVAKYLKNHSLQHILGHLEEKDVVVPAVNTTIAQTPYGIELSEYGIDTEMDIFGDMF